MGILLATLALYTPIPAAAAALPCRQPQLAADGQAVYLACGADETIYISRSSDGGRSFAPLTRVASVSSLSLGMHRGPRIVVSDDALVVARLQISVRDDLPVLPSLVGDCLGRHHPGEVPQTSWTAIAISI